MVPLRKLNTCARALVIAFLIWTLLTLLAQMKKSKKPMLRTDSEKSLLVERSPSIEYEQLRRRIHSNIQELYNFVDFELTNIQQNNPHLGKHIDQVIEMTAEHKRSLIHDMDHLRKIDGHEEWRRTETERLGDLMQRRIGYIQNPKDCSNAKKISCGINFECGFGCQFHHLVYCFIVAYATERMLVLDSNNWNYHKDGWEAVFKPLSDSCATAETLDYSLFKHTFLYDINDSRRKLSLPLIQFLNPRPPFLPMAIPEDLAPTLKRLHGDPIVWFVGQFVKYLLRFNSATEKVIDASMKKLNLKGSFVGVHIRRSDEIATGTAFHDIEEYMKHVDEYYNQVDMEQKIEKRRVYIATDDPKAIDEIRGNYSHYEVFGNSDAAKLSSLLGTRYSEASLFGLIFDIHVLSQSDYIVCTFSSQICRIVYELMQTRFPDASQRFKSLDDIYFFGGQHPHNRIAVLSHHPKNSDSDEMIMNAGDIINIARNYWDGFSVGENTRTEEMGYFPSFKVNDEIITAKFPNYSNIF